MPRAEKQCEYHLILASLHGLYITALESVKLIPVHIICSNTQIQHGQLSHKCYRSRADQSLWREAN